MLRLALPCEPGAAHPLGDPAAVGRMQRQILPDGGHISRNPGALVDLLSDLLPLADLSARNIAPPPALLNRSTA